jgi:hypothetical protein
MNAEKAYLRVRGWGWHRVCKIIVSILLLVTNLLQTRKN